MNYRLTAAALIAATLLLSGCESGEERAEEHFQTALEFLDAGDTKRAVLEMRNALQLAPTHEDARKMLADIRREEGDLPRAVSHYRKLIEDHPQNGEGHLALAQLALELGDWKAAEKHGGKAEEILGETPAVQAVKVNMAYRDALEAQENKTRDAVAQQAVALLATDPSLINARRIAIDAQLRAEDWLEALTLIDDGLTHDPDRYDLYQMRLGVLEQLGRTDVITTQLEDMVERFPEEETLPMTLVRWYVSNDDIDAAEVFLRKEAEASPEKLDLQTRLVQFLNETRGAEVAGAELERLAAAGGKNVVTYRAMRANLMFQNGDAEAARVELEDILADLPEEQATSSVSDDVRVDLARMKALEGDQEGARALISTVLKNDPTKVPALKMRGAWQIEGDQVEDAVVNLRAALRESPRDPQIMTLMAAAHERAGEPELQREMLSLAVEASRSAPAESLRYAQMLLGEERYRPAEDVLLDALRLHRDDVSLYAGLGRVYVALADWPRAEQVIDTLNGLVGEGENDPAKAVVNTLRAQILAGQRRDSELFDFLDDLSNNEDAGLAAQVAIIRTHAARGDNDKARERLDAAMAESPDQPMLRFLSAALMASDGAFEASEAEMEALLKDFPQAEPVWMALYRMQLVQGDREAAAEVLSRALEAMPDGGNLLFSRAGELESSGDIDGAIDIYETLYERNSSNELVANNLASLLSMYRQDEETMERAYRIGRRLQGSENPALRDTYGWIATRMGRLDEGERHLKFAAEGIPNHPIILYHYAVALAGLERDAEALDYFRKAEAAAGNILPQADLDVVKSEIARLEAPATGTEAAPSETQQ